MKQASHTRYSPRDVLFTIANGPHPPPDKLMPPDGLPAFTTRAQMQRVLGQLGAPLPVGAYRTHGHAKVGAHDKERFLPEDAVRYRRAGYHAVELPSGELRILDRQILHPHAAVLQRSLRPALVLQKSGTDGGSLQGSTDGWEQRLLQYHYRTRHQPRAGHTAGDDADYGRLHREHHWSGLADHEHAGGSVLATKSHAAAQAGRWFAEPDVLRKALTPNLDIRAGAQAYNRRAGLPPIQEGHYVRVNEPHARQIADAYDALPDVDPSPATQAAYGALGQEVQAQWDHARRQMGVQFEAWRKAGQPYADSAEMMQDLGQRRHLYFFQGGEPHPLLGQPDAEGYSLNDKFRAVHDLFGHAAEGYGFGPRGEENAWLKHSQMFSPQAQQALTTETRGQNSWVNFGRHNYAPTGEPRNIPASDRPFAKQKAALLPPEHRDWQHTLSQDRPKALVV